MGNGQVNSNDSAADAFAALSSIRARDKMGGGSLPGEAAGDQAKAEQSIEAKEDQLLTELEAALQKALNAVQALKSVQTAEKPAPAPLDARESLSTMPGAAE
jgi:hypothetical protein